MNRFDKIVARPKVNAWANFFFCSTLLAIVGLCLWAFADGWFPGEMVLKKHPEPQDEFYAFNKILAITLFPFIFIFAVPVWILMAKKREPWAWTTILVYIVLCFAPSIIWLIPFLIFWIKPNNKAYYEKI